MNTNAHGFYGVFDRVVDITLITLLSTIVLLTGTQILLRDVFDVSLTWSLEVVNYEFVWLCSIGLGWAFGRRIHMLADFVVGMLPPRLHKAVRVINELFAFFFMAVLVYLGFQVIQVLDATHSVTPTLQIPSAYAYASIPVGALVGVVYIVRNLYGLTRSGVMTE